MSKNKIKLITSILLTCTRHIQRIPDARNSTLQCLVARQEERPETVKDSLRKRSLSVNDSNRVSINN